MNFGSDAPPSLVTKQAITVVSNGESKTVKRESALYDEVLLAVQEERWHDAVDLMDREKAVVKASDSKMRVEHGKVFVKGDDGSEFSVSSALNDTIINYMDEGLNFDSLVKFAQKLNLNPSYRSVQQLFDFIQNTNLTITTDGNFIAYKSINKNFTDVRTGKFDNSVGTVVSMPRNQVDEDPERTCSHGLHVATYSYAHDEYAGEITVFVEVNPRDVVAVPVDYNRAKMRVCEYKVLGESEGEFKDRIYDPFRDDEEEEEEEEEEERYCDDCGEHEDDCYCDDICPDCDERIDDCFCGDDCPYCHHLVSDCRCESRDTIPDYHSLF